MSIGRKWTRVVFVFFASIIVLINCAPTRSGLEFRDGASCNSNCFLEIPSTGSEDEEPSIEAFRTSVYAITRAKCVFCHNSPPVIRGMPEHASDDILTAYNAALSKIDPQIISESILVFRTTNGHCGANCMTDGSEMTAAIQIWMNRLNPPQS